MSRPFKIFFIAAEASPFAKVGGLGDVIGSLPRELRRVGHDARILLPYYSTIDSSYDIVSKHDLEIPFLGKQETVEILEVKQKNEVPLYLLKNATYFDRMAVYGEHDDGERFQFFSRAAMEVPKKLNWRPDIIHCHDWHTALCCGLLRFDYHGDKFYASTASVFTIHNLSYQGWFDDAYIWKTNLHKYLLPSGNPLRSKTYSMMGIGIAHCDVLTTVSETYAREILTTEYGCGMENLLQSRRDSLFGILNGIDYEEFDPATDTHIPANYNLKNLEAKVENKLALQKLVGLPVNKDTPLVGMAGRLVDQKGPDIAAEAMASLLPDADVQLIMQGTGETRYREILEKLESCNIRKARLFFILDFALIDLIYAGSDIFLMPSRYEPCGLAPMIAMRYGTVPVVRHTGGMVETVTDCSPDLSAGLGFVFNKYESAGLLLAIRRALSSYRDKEKWQELMIRDMSIDYSWRAAIPKYESIYEIAQQRAAKH